ncbi:alpha/beta fold hydrolase [Stenomitos frigidus]|uniref:Hydrolase n=1 Tax=Stenomitos frigidus ULC18 TaxID=2107698 RepID=A0A2T1E2Y5_9CYAN|nr:alpha/beta fold hydrolase [Stenomitos frigidus]PSB26984.1 hydrolase [Stenomitos frigidus ULC18]
MATGDNWIEVGKLTWFYREALPLNSSDRVPVVLLHGIPAQSYSWREVLPALANQGFRAIAPDWIGSGFSEQPDRRDFAYTPEAFLQALESFLQAMGIERFALVVQGFVGSVGLQYALRHPEQIDRLAILNAPLSTAAKLPWKMRQLGIPLVGDMMTQDPLLIDRTLEGGGGYRVEDADLDIYRRPFLRSSDAGRSLLATIQNLQLKQVTAEIETGFQQWSQPILVAWGLRDPWLPLDMAKQFIHHLADAELVELEEVGHYPQEDWHEKVSAALLPFLRRQPR